MFVSENSSLSYVDVQGLSVVEFFKILSIIDDGRRKDKHTVSDRRGGKGL